VNTASPAQDKRPTWNFLRSFSRKLSPVASSWACFEAMKEAAPLDSSLRRYKRLLQIWNRRLDQLGGDPSTLDWSDFRPLRLSREEDWSDWLGWLFQNSNGGELASNLFGGPIRRPARFFSNPEIKREDPTEDQERRGDILLLWPRRLGIMLEVKVGDERFGKTFETGCKLKAKHKRSAPKWKNFILIPKESLGAWNESARIERLGKTDVDAILWEDVVRILRRCLWSKLESAVWRTWAWTLCGAIEQKLLGLDRQQTGKRANFGQFAALIRWIELLDLEKGKRI
jgi:hypothetical protein